MLLELFIPVVFAWHSFTLCGNAFPSCCKPAACEKVKHASYCEYLNGRVIQKDCSYEVCYDGINCERPQPGCDDDPTGGI